MPPRSFCAAAEREGAVRFHRGKAARRPAPAHRSTAPASRPGRAAPCANGPGRSMPRGVRRHPKRARATSRHPYCGAVSRRNAPASNRPPRDRCPNGRHGPDAAAPPTRRPVPASRSGTGHRPCCRYERSMRAAARRHRPPPDSGGTRTATGRDAQRPPGPKDGPSSSSPLRVPNRYRNPRRPQQRPPPQAPERANNKRPPRTTANRISARSFSSDKFGLQIGFRVRMKLEGLEHTVHPGRAQRIEYRAVRSGA